MHYWTPLSAIKFIFSAWGIWAEFWFRLFHNSVFLVVSRNHKSISSFFFLFLCEVQIFMPISTSYVVFLIPIILRKRVDSVLLIYNHVFILLFPVARQPEIQMVLWSVCGITTDRAWSTRFWPAPSSSWSTLSPASSSALRRTCTTARTCWQSAWSSGQWPPSWQVWWRSTGSWPSCDFSWALGG